MRFLENFSRPSTPTAAASPPNGTDSKQPPLPTPSHSTTTRGTTLTVKEREKQKVGHDKSIGQSAKEKVQDVAKHALGGTEHKDHHVEAERPSTSTSNGVRRSNTTATTATTTGKRSSVRPGLERRTTVQTRYIEMLLSLDAIPRLHNILASFFTWLLLAGYIVFPATFTSLRRNETLARQEQDAGTVIEEHLLQTVRNAPLLVIAAVCCGVGALGCGWLWRRWRGNYVWLLNRIFLPSFMNALAGLISTLVNVYSAQDGAFSVTARVTIVVTSACAAVTAGLFVVYNWVMLRRVKRRHHREVNGLDAVEEGKAGAAGMEVGSGRVV